MCGASWETRRPLKYSIDNVCHRHKCEAVERRAFDRSWKQCGQPLAGADRIAPPMLRPDGLQVSLGKRHAVNNVLNTFLGVNG